MVDYLLPKKLHAGSHIRVVAPSMSLGVIENHVVEHANAVLEEMGLETSAGEHIYEMDRYGSSTIESRVNDLHDAFADDTVDAIFAVMGGNNSNELLPYLDFELISKHPKIFCGFSDINCLQNAITVRTGLVTYSGPHWSTFGMRDDAKQTIEWFRNVLMSEDSAIVKPTDWFTDDYWFSNQDARRKLTTDGWWILQDGVAQGRVFGGNLSSFRLLQGTLYMPELRGAILCAETEAPVDFGYFKRELVSLLQTPAASEIAGLMIGRFQVNSSVSREDLEFLLNILDLPPHIPVLANVEFGHTNPLLTLPIGGEIKMEATPSQERIVIY